MIEFKIGDIVQLKSGGPKMTVENPGSSTNLWCQWFAGSKLEKGNFPKESLNKIDESKKKEN